jgi:hypothetical protein
MITTPTVSGKPGQAPTGLSCDLYPLIGSQHLDRSSGSRHSDGNTVSRIRSASGAESNVVNSTLISCVGSSRLRMLHQTARW